MINWFKKHKKVLTVVAVLIGGPTATIYIESADAVVDAVQEVTKEQPEQGADGGK